LKQEVEVNVRLYELVLMLQRFCEARLWVSSWWLVSLVLSCVRGWGQKFTWMV